jgi:hypothetical protein
VYVYGRLSGENAGGIVPIDMIYFKKKLEGWLVMKWLSEEPG